MVNTIDELILKCGMNIDFGNNRYGHYGLYPSWLLGSEVLSESTSISYDGISYEYVLKILINVMGFEEKSVKDVIESLKPKAAEYVDNRLNGKEMYVGYGEFLIYDVLLEGLFGDDSFEYTFDESYCKILNIIFSNVINGNSNEDFEGWITYLVFNSSFIVSRLNIIIFVVFGYIFNVEYNKTLSPIDILKRKVSYTRSTYSYKQFFIKTEFLFELERNRGSLTDTKVTSDIISCVTGYDRVSVLDVLVYLMSKNVWLIDESVFDHACSMLDSTYVNEQEYRREPRSIIDDALKGFGITDIDTYIIWEVAQNYNVTSYTSAEISVWILLLLSLAKKGGNLNA